jgi:hypothetical protein
MFVRVKFFDYGDTRDYGGPGDALSDHAQSPDRQITRLLGNQ